ncbi:hypothetical protein [Pseudoalteromonas sp.]|nr:hypothetical protein [Pseudoalteromonas sp.]MCP4585645.1 hypothetical protein [Pseudoalteromonas sp.]
MEFNLKVSEQELNTIIAGLGELKAKAVIPVIESIKTQIAEQQKFEESEV